MKHSQDYARTAMPSVASAPPAFRAVLCDLDGTLIDSSRDIAAAFQWALRHVTGDEPPAVAAITAHIGKPLETMARDVGYVFSTQVLTTFLDTYRRYYAQHCARHTRPYPGVMDTLHVLSTTTFGVVTTKAQEQAEHVLHQLQMSQYFRHIQGWQPGLRLKPAPDTVTRTLEALQCPPHQALMVGDTSADIAAGKAASVQTCAVTYGFGTRDDLLDGAPDYCIASFEDLISIVRRSSSA